MTMPDAGGALVKSEDGEAPLAVYMEAPPKRILEEARTAAKALQEVIQGKAKKVVMNGEQYLEFEDWQTLGRFYGITAKCDDPEFVAFGDVTGFKASAVALYRGEVISRATAYCLSDEEKWGTRPKYEWQYVCQDGTRQTEHPGYEQIVWEPNPAKPGKNKPKKERALVGEEKVPLFQLASMAQTRAAAKVHRQVLAWVVVLAGYKPTPAEELDSKTQVLDADVVPHREPGSDDALVIETSAGTVTVGSGQHAEAAGARDYQKAAPSARGPRPDCPTCGSNAKVINAKFKRDQGVWYCMADKTSFGPREQPAGRVDSTEGHE
jgi:hypothetical protein